MKGPTLRILVLGAGGMIGRKLCARLAADGAIAGGRIDEARLVDLDAPVPPVDSPFATICAAVDLAAEPAAVIRLVVDLAPRGAPPSRLPAEEELSTEILGVRLPRIALDPAHGPADHAHATLESLTRRI